MADGSTESDFFDCRAAADLLTHDVGRVVRTLGLDAGVLSRVLVTDEAAARRIVSGHVRIAPASPEGVRAMRLVRLNRALGDAYGTVDAVIAFLRAPDADDGLVPLDLLQQPDGIERVFARLDSLGADVWRPQTATSVESSSPRPAGDDSGVVAAVHA